MISFRALLPKRLQATTWGDIIASSESFMATEIKQNYIDAKYYCYPDYYTIPVADLKVLVDKFGDEYLTLDGYTSTDEFFIRRVNTLNDRRQFRRLPEGYRKVLFIYILNGNVFPLLNQGSFLYAWEDYYTAPESVKVYFQLDTGWTLDDGFQLDNFEYYSQVTNHFVIEYEPIFIENATEFISDNTSFAFLRDVEVQKKIVEVPHFECKINVYADTANLIGNPKLTAYTDRTHTLAANQSTYYNIGALTNYKTVRLSLNGASIQNFDIATTFDVILDTTVVGQQQLFMKQLITWNTKILTFNEITLYDSTGAIIVKATIPTVNFNANMLSSVRLYFYLD